MIIKTALVASGLVATLLLAACTGGTTPAKPSSTAGTDGSQKSITVVAILGATGDPFWSTIKRGAESAATAVQAAGGKVTYLNLANYNNVGPDLAKLESNALALHPSVVVIVDAIPDAQNPGIVRLVKAGIPVFIYNSGGSEVKATGAITYIGSDDYTAGLGGGQKFSASGAKHILCVNTLPGQHNSDARCLGIADAAKKGGAVASDLNLPSTQFGDPTAVTQAIKGAVLQDSSIDAVATIGVGDSESAASALEQAGLTGKVVLGTFDISSSGLARIKAGTQLFSIDQQPFAQGYYGISEAFHYVAYGIKMPQDPLLTGPNVIDKSSVDLAVNGSKLGVR